MKRGMVLAFKTQDSEFSQIGFSKPPSPEVLMCGDVSSCSKRINWRQAEFTMQPSDRTSEQTWGIIASLFLRARKSHTEVVVVWINKKHGLCFPDTFLCSSRHI